MVHILFGVLPTTVYTFFKTLSVHLRSVHFTILIHKDSGEFPKWASGERQVPSLTSQREGIYALGVTGSAFHTNTVDSSGAHPRKRRLKDKVVLEDSVRARHLQQGSLRGTVKSDVDFLQLVSFTESLEINCGLDFGSPVIDSSPHWLRNVPKPFPRVFRHHSHHQQRGGLSAYHFPHPLTDHDLILHSATHI